jgi:hypothetical protein
MRRGKRVQVIQLPTEDPEVEVIYIPVAPIEMPIPVELPQPQYIPNYPGTIKIDGVSFQVGKVEIK